MASSAQTVPQLSGAQSRVHETLAARNPRLAELYLIAVNVSGDRRNPGRIFLAGHAFRELMNELPRAIDAPVIGEQVKFDDRFRTLKDEWLGSKQSTCHADGVWGGEIDRVLHGFLAKLEDFFAWYKHGRPDHILVAAEFFRRLDPAVATLPVSLEKARAKGWVNLLRFFNKAAHRSDIPDADFDARVDDLERVLVDTLYRRPSESLAVIDELLREAGNA